MAGMKVCPFCCRSYHFEEGDEEKVRGREDSWRRWWIFLRRYFGGNELNGGAFGDGWVESGVGFCEGCGLLVDGILEEYHQLKCVELRLGWKLECLAEIVRLGNRVKERKVGMRRTVEENLGEGKGERVCKRVRGFRKDFLRKCSGGLARSYPLVVLDRRKAERRNRDRDLRNALDDPEKVPDGLGNEDLEGVPGKNGKKTRWEESTKISDQTKEIQVHLYLSADDHLNLSHYEDRNKLVRDDMVTTSSSLPVSRGSSVAGGREDDEETLIYGISKKTQETEIDLKPCRKRRRSQTGLDLSEERVESQPKDDNQLLDLLQTPEETNVEPKTVNPTTTTLDTINWQCQCEVCSDWFRSASILKLHRKLKHGDGSSSQHSVTTTVDETSEYRQSEVLEDISTSSPSPIASFQVKTEGIMDAEEDEDHEDSRSSSKSCEPPSLVTSPCASPLSTNIDNFDSTESTAPNQDDPVPINTNTAIKITIISQEQNPAVNEPICAIPFNGEIVNELSTLLSVPSSLSPSKPKAPKVEDTADSEQNSTDQLNTAPYNLRRSSRKTVTKYVEEDVSDDDDDTHNQTDANYQQESDASSDPDSDFEPSFNEIKEEMEIETDTRLKCPICGKMLKCTAGLEVHMGIMHKNSPTVSPSNYQSLKCTLCTSSKRTFLTINRLKMHFKWRHPSNKLSFERLSSLESLPNPTVKCELCEKLFFTRKDLRWHTKSCRKQLHGQFSCKFCAKMETFAPDLSRHELQHSKRNAGAIGLPFFYCPRCPFKVLRNENAYINHHLAMHLGIAKDKTRLWHCPICQLTRADFQKVKRQHFARFHDLQGVNPESVKWCEEKGCSAYFLRKHQLDAHRKLVHYVSEEVPEEGDNEHVGETEETEVHEKDTHGKEVRKKQVQERESCSEPTFECKLCFKHFRHEKLLEQHMKMLHLANKYRIRKKPIFCSEPTCNEKFSDKNCLQAHKLLHGHWKCGFCSVEKDYAPDIAVHEADHGVRTFHEEDEKASSSAAALTEKISHKYRRFNCPRCKYFGNSKTLYVRHFVEKHLNISTKTHTCSICNAKIRGNSVAFHFETHHNTDDIATEDIQRCDQCPAYFLFGIQLLRHKTEMHFDCNSKCPVCGGGPYKDRKSYFQHYNKYHDKSEDPSLPEVCNAKNCGKRFATKPELEWHLTFGHRLNDKPNDGWVDCKLCHKRYWKQQGLQTHMKHSHPKEPKKKRTFVCELCGKDFSTKARLQTHMVYHQDPETWKFECEICKKKCADKWKLQAHMQTHTKDKVAYQCEHCGQSYAHRHNWRNHVKDKHGIVIPIARGHSLSGPRSVVKERALMKQGQF